MRLFWQVVAPAQRPALQVSFVVHASPSSQAVPSGATGFEQMPVAGSHVPAMWHWSRAVQVTPAQRSGVLVGVDVSVCIAVAAFVGVLVAVGV
jgi:hypothetical protein